MDPWLTPMTEPRLIVYGSLFPNEAAPTSGTYIRERMFRVTRRLGIQENGRVPDVRPCLAHADLALAPLRFARGTQNEMQDALATVREMFGHGPYRDGCEGVQGDHRRQASLDTVDVLAAIA